MPTNTSLITDALKAAAIIADGQTTSASELADGLTALNRMMAVWKEENKDIGFFPQDTASDDCPIPKWAEEAVQDNLTVRLCKIYRVPVSPEIAMSASNGDDFITKMVINENLEGANMNNMPASSNVRGSILNGTYYGN